MWEVGAQGEEGHWGGRRSNSDSNNSISSRNSDTNNSNSINFNQSLRPLHPSLFLELSPYRIARAESQPHEDVQLVQKGQVLLQNLSGLRLEERATQERMCVFVKRKLKRLKMFIIAKAFLTAFFLYFLSFFLS